MFNTSNLVIDRVANIDFTDYQNGNVIARLDEIEDPELQISSEADDVVDALGSYITRIYRAKNAKFTATSSLFNTDLLALQTGTDKIIADTTDKIKVPCWEVLPVKDGKITLTNTPVDDIKYIYLFKRKELCKSYVKGAAAASETEFSITDKEITVPTGITEGEFYVEYTYESENAIKVINNSSDFPKIVGCKIYVYFLDKCTDELYKGAIVSKRAKIDPSSISIALTSTGKHSFDVDFLRDYCGDGELFHFVIPGVDLAA